MQDREYIQCRELDYQIYLESLVAIQNSIESFAYIACGYE